MIKSLTDAFKYEHNYTQQTDTITVSLDLSTGAVSIKKEHDICETQIWINKSTVPGLIKMLEEIVK